MRIRRFSLAAGLVSGWALLCAPSVLAGGVQVPVPCKEANKGAAATYLRSCTSSLVIVEKPVIQQIIDNLEIRIRGEQKTIYEQGLKGAVIKDDGSAVTNDPDQPAVYFGRPSCNLVKDALTPAEEGLLPSPKNHLQQSCGQFIHIQVDVGGISVIPPSIGSTDTTVTVATTLDKDGVTQGPGTAELSFIRGAWTHALACSWKEVENEIKNNKKLTVSPGCDAGGAALNGMLADAQSTASSLTSQITEDTGLDVTNIELCQIQSDWHTSSSADGNGAAVGKLRQSVAYLCSARHGLEAMFTHLALCEIFARAGPAYREVFSDTTAFLKGAEDTVAAACKSQCKSKCDPSCITSFSESCTTCATNCANGCYPGELLKWLIPQITAKWKSCQSSATPAPKRPGPTEDSGGFLFFASIALAGKRRRRSLFQRALALAGVNLAALAAFTYLSTGCGSSASVAGTYPPGMCPKAELGGGKPECCDPSNGQLVKPTPAGCDSKTPDEPAATRENKQMGDMSKITSDLVSKASALKGDTEKPESVLSEESPDAANGTQNAATAGQELAKGGPSQAAGANGGNGAPGGAASAKGAGKFVSGAPSLAGGGDVSGGLAGLGSGSTAPAGGATDGAGGSSSSGSGDPNSAGGMYGARGGGGAYGGGSDRGGDNLSGSSGSAGFDKDGAGTDAGGKAMGDEDPDDYFNRIGKHESLFTRVTRRYGQKSMGWAREDAGLDARPNAGKTGAKSRL